MKDGDSWWSMTTVDARERRVEKSLFRRGLERRSRRAPRRAATRRARGSPGRSAAAPAGPASRARAPSRDACARLTSPGMTRQPDASSRRRGSAPRSTSRRSTEGGSSVTTVPPAMARPPRPRSGAPAAVTSRAPRGAGGPRPPASAAWSAHQLSERCASSSSTVFPCCSTHVKYFRLCQRSRFSRVPSVIQSSFCPRKIDARCASARSRVSGPVRVSRRRRTDGYRSRPSVATVTTASSFPSPSHRAVLIAPRMLQTPLTPRSVESRCAASPSPPPAARKSRPAGSAHELETRAGTPGRRSHITASRFVTWWIHVTCLSPIPSIACPP